MVVLPFATLPSNFETKLASNGQRGLFGIGLAGGEDLHGAEGCSKPNTEAIRKQLLQVDCLDGRALGVLSGLHSKPLGDLGRKTYQPPR